MEARGELCADGGDMNDIDGGGEDGELAHFSVCDADGGDAQSDDGDEKIAMMVYTLVMMRTMTRVWISWRTRLR